VRLWSMARARMRAITGRFRALANALPRKPFGPTTEGLGVAAADMNGDGHQDQ
jgi:hypothetical protein